MKKLKNLIFFKNFSDYAKRLHSGVVILQRNSEMNAEFCAMHQHIKINKVLKWKKKSLTDVR